MTRLLIALAGLALVVVANIIAHLILNSTPVRGFPVFAEFWPWWTVSFVLLCTGAWLLFFKRPR